MKRVMVIGNSGTGKSTFSRKLAEKTGLPLHHLDKHFWKPGWIETPDDEFNLISKNLTLGDKWIIDGNYSRTMSIRLERADTIILITNPGIKCVYRVLKRLLKSKFNPRIDVAEGCKDKFDWEFIKWIWNYENRSGKRTRELLSTLKDINIHILKTNKEVKDFLHFM